MDRIKRACVIPFPVPALHSDDDYRPDYYDPVCGLCTYRREVSSPYSRLNPCAEWCSPSGEALPEGRTCQAWEGNF